jgi:hypothetical protein
MPKSGLIPNQPLRVTVRKDREPVPEAAAADLIFSFASSWDSYTDALPVSAGSAGGGEELTIHGVGFAINASYGEDGDYACKFEAAGVSPALLSKRVQPLSSRVLVCVTPSWGSVHIARRVEVSVVKGGYTYPQPAGGAAAASYEFLPSWHDWSSAAGPVGGGDLLTITGVGFNSSRLHRCLFDYNGGQLIAFSEPVLPRSRATVVCVTPVWKSWRDASTRLKLLVGDAPGSAAALAVEGMSEVLQMLTQARGFLNASYQFLVPT